MKDFSEAIVGQLSTWLQSFLSRKRLLEDIVAWTTPNERIAIIAVQIIAVRCILKVCDLDALKVFCLWVYVM